MTAGGTQHEQPDRGTPGDKTLSISMGKSDGRASWGYMDYLALALRALGVIWQADEGKASGKKGWSGVAGSHVPRDSKTPKTREEGTRSC